MRGWLWLAQARLRPYFCSLNFSPAATYDICPRISPLGFCLVRISAYACPAFIILARSETCLPFKGPCRFEDVIVPSDNTPLIGIFSVTKPKIGRAVRERNNVARAGPFSPLVPL